MSWKQGSLRRWYETHYVVVSTMLTFNSFVMRPTQPHATVVSTIVMFFFCYHATYVTICYWSIVDWSPANRTINSSSDIAFRCLRSVATLAIWTCLLRDTGVCNPRPGCFFCNTVSKAAKFGSGFRRFGYYEPQPIMICSESMRPSFVDRLAESLACNQNCHEP